MSKYAIWKLYKTNGIDPNGRDLVWRSNFCVSKRTSGE